MTESTALLAMMTALGGLLALAQAADQKPALRWLAYLALLSVDGLMALLGLLFFTAISMLQSGEPALERLGLDSAFLSNTSRLMLLSAALGLILLLPQVRRLIAKVLPIDPERVAHAAALQFAVYLVAISGFVYFALPMVVASPEAFSVGGPQMLVTLWVQMLGFFIIAALGVGLFVKLDGRATLERLGLTRHFDVKWWLAATAIGLASGHAIDLIWQAVAPESLGEVEKITDVLFGPLLALGLPGVLTIGLSAGLGEEVLFRGAAQPKLGLLFTTFLFAALHTQYSISPALIQVFVIGLILGLTRQRVNTTTSIAVHASYNTVIALLALYAPQLRP